MDNNTINNKNNYLKLDNLKDVQDLVCDVLTECKDTGSMVEHASKITQLLQVWLKAYSLGIEVEMVKDLEARITALEGGKE